MFRKSCHLPVELGYEAYWPVKTLNFDLKVAGEKRMLHLSELDGLRLEPYGSFQDLQRKGQAMA